MSLSLREDGGIALREDGSRELEEITPTAIFITAVLASTSTLTVTGHQKRQNIAGSLASISALAVDAQLRPIRLTATLASISTLTAGAFITTSSFGAGGGVAGAFVPSSSEISIDKHIRRGGDDYANALSDLLPSGLAWSRELDRTLMKVISGLAQIFGYVDSRAADLLERETDPRTTFEMLADWERNWGLPDPCWPQPTTIQERRNLLIAKMTMLGGQSREFFIALAAWLGYTITITEFAPFMVGVSNVGDTRASISLPDNPINYHWQIGAPEMRFYWVVHLSNLGLIWFRCGSGQFGIDHHLNIVRAENLECLFRRLQPAHTQVIFDYSGLAYSSDPMAGTP